MAGDRWPHNCRALLVKSVDSAAKAFPKRPDQAPEGVHDLRKTLKEARALTRLFLKSVGEPARVTIAALAAVRRRVGQARDLDVMEQRLARLQPPVEIAKPVAEVIARERSATRRAHSGFKASASRRQLAAIARRLEAWDVDGVGESDIVEGVARSYRQARRRGHAAFETSDPAALHALRSRVVDLRYQLAALAPAWPAALTAQAEELNALRDSLGAFNDLNVLGTFARERCGLPPEAMNALNERLEERQKKLRRRARVEFDRLFAETPNAFAERLAAYVKNPMEEPRAGETPPSRPSGQ